MQPRTECPTRLVMVPFDLRESMSIAVAAKLSGRAGNTIRLWAERHGIGRKIRRLAHQQGALRIFLDGDMAALAAYHAGNRTNPLVRPHFERGGCGALLLHSMGGTIRAIIRVHYLEMSGEPA
jgi:hypothetical protein